jgi:hypothetical protein
MADWKAFACACGRNYVSAEHRDRCACRQQHFALGMTMESPGLPDGRLVALAHDSDGSYGVFYSAAEPWLCVVYEPTLRTLCEDEALELMDDFFRAQPWLQWDRPEPTQRTHMQRLLEIGATLQALHAHGIVARSRDEHTREPLYSWSGCAFHDGDLLCTRSPGHRGRHRLVDVYATHLAESA